MPGPVQTHTAPLFTRFWQYQGHRFPFLAHGPLIAAFSFSVISFSRIARGESGFIDWPSFVLVWLTCVGLFFLLRVADEHKDAADDRRYRPELPVPSGLISLKELRWIAGPMLGLIVLAHVVWAPSVLPYLGLALVYLGLMTKEFFVGEWLKTKQWLYVGSHMLIVPLIDLYASAFDWQVAGAIAPTGLWWFFAISFMNGIVLEVGRKIRIPADERSGVITYSSLYGAKQASRIWMGALVMTWALCMAAITWVGYSWIAYLLHTLYLVLSLGIGVRFLQKVTAKRAQHIELVAGLWTLAMYLTLGGFPMLLHWLT